MSDDHPIVTAALQDGWHVGGGGRGLRAFTRVWSGDQAAPWVVLIPAIVGSDGDLPILVDQPAPAELARRLQMFADALGHPWKISPATTGIDLLTSLRFTDKARLLDAHTPVAPATNPGVEQDLSWSRIPTSSEAPPIKK